MKRHGQMSEMSVVEKRSLSGGLRTRNAYKEAWQDAPLVTIVTVVFNGATHLEQTIASVLAQDYQPLEYIIIDGGSTDGTLDSIRKYEDRVDYWASEADRGIYDAMNKGIALARGTWIGLLNADDYYEPGAVSAVMARVKEYPGSQLVYGNTYVVQERLGIRYKWYASTKYWLGMCFSHQALWVHSEVYRQFGGYDDSLRIAADYDFVVKCFTSGLRMASVDAFVVNYRDSGISARNLMHSMWEGRHVLRRYVGLVSKQHLVFSGLVLKSLLFTWIMEVLQVCFGPTVVIRCSEWYIRTVIAKERESIQ